MTPSTSQKFNAQARFGTFGGVFTPCVLTILGVIMFTLAPKVVGVAGIGQALLILLMAKVITGLTTLSLSAIATNTEVRTGGVYYMISRSLGSDFGGAIGLTLYLSQAISIAFYVIGFTEILYTVAAPEGSDMARMVAEYSLHELTSSVVIVLIFLVTFKGADLAIRAQYFILGVLLLAVISFIIGGVVTFDSSTAAANWGPLSDNAFWPMFAILFPAATGITAGANLSGDLKDPARAIPIGTLYAIGFTAIIYVLEIVLLGGFSGAASLTASGTAREGLALAPKESIINMSILGVLVIAGAFAATLSSALGSFLGAPRIMQAMGKDRLLPALSYFGVGHGPSDEPRRATVLSLGIAMSIVWMGGLEAVAEVITMFFLIAYGMINLSAFVEGAGGNPSFRPRFRFFSWPLALAGTIGCAIAMLKINQTSAIVSIMVAAAIYLWLRNRPSGGWEDAKRGFIFKRTRQNLLLLEGMTPDPKNWRPVLAVLTFDQTNSRNVLKTASWLENRRGLLSILEIRQDARPLAERIDERHKRVEMGRSLLKENDIAGFSDSIVAPKVELDQVLQAYSIGHLRPNTLMAELPSDDDTLKDLSRRMRVVSEFGQSIVFFHDSERECQYKQIDIWWHGQRNGSLLALFAYLVSIHPSWKKSTIRMLRIVTNQRESMDAKRSLYELMEAARLRVNIDVIVSDAPISEIIVEKSKDTDLVLMGMADATVRDVESFVKDRRGFLSSLPRTLFVLSNGEVDLLA